MRHQYPEMRAGRVYGVGRFTAAVDQRDRFFFIKYPLAPLSFYTFHVQLG